MLCLSAVALLVLPRKWAILPFVVMTVLVSPAQRIVIGGLDFTFFRILLLAGWFRVLMRNEHRSLRLGNLEALLVLWAVSGTAIFTARVGTTSSLVYQLGASLESIGLFLLLRCLIRNHEDVLFAFRCLGWFVLPVLGFFVIEKMTGRNMFAVFGGVPQFTAVREGTRRVQGAFAHPIVAGVFWASLLPFFVYQYWETWLARPRVVVIAAATLVMTILTGSSTPIMTLFALLVAAGAFHLRDHMRWIRWMAATGIVALHVVMEAPVWHLISRIDLAGGSTGWHRYNVINKAIMNFDEWALTGTSNIDHWGIWYNDITNEFVAQGLRGGVLTLALFVGVLICAFRYVGQCRASVSRGGTREILIWILGSALFAHVTTFFALSYFGQADFAWYLTIAAIASLHQELIVEEEARNVMPNRLAFEGVHQ